MSLLMEHNVPVYKEFCKCLKENHECILITATGTGKSYIVEEFLQQHNEVALVVVPRVSIKQSWEELSSNVSVVTYSWFKDHYNEVVDQFRYVVFDEAHHIGGDGPWGIAFREFKQLSASTYLIGLTADSVRYSDKNKDVAEREFDGHVVYGYDTSEAVKKGILPNAQYVSALFNLPVLKKALHRRIEAKSINPYKKHIVDKLFGRLDMAIKNYSSIQQILQYHLSKAGNRKGIVFVDSIRNISKTVSLMKSTFKTDPIFYIHSDMKDSVVIETINLFKSVSHGYIVAVDMLNEGVHIDGVNTIIMLRKTKSPSIYKQQIGRALSSANPDALVYIFDFVGNASEIIDYYNTTDPYKADDDETNKHKYKRIGPDTRSPIISAQIIVDDSTKNIISVVDRIKQLTRPTYSDEELTEIFSSCNNYEDAVKATGLQYEYIIKRAKELGFSDLLSSVNRYPEEMMIPIFEKCNTIEEILAELGLSKKYETSIRRVIHRFGYQNKFIKPVSPQRKITDEEIEIIRAMAKKKNKYTTTDIGKRLGITSAMAYRTISRLGLLENFKIKRPRSDKEVERIIEICKTSNTLNEARSKIRAEFPGISNHSISGYINQYNPQNGRIKEQSAQLDDIIKKYYESMGPREIHNKYLPDIPFSRLIRRAKELGIKYKRTIDIDKYRDIVEQYYSSYGSKIVEMFDIPFSRSQISSYASSIGVKRMYNTQNPEIINMIKDNMDSKTESQICDEIKRKFGVTMYTTTINLIKKRIRNEEAQ